MTDKLYSKIRGNPSGKLNNSGYSLLEVLIGMAILTIGMLATSALAIGIINGNSVSKHVSTAAVLAQEKIESIRETGYSGLPSSDWAETETDISYTIGEETVSYDGYTRTTVGQVDTPMTDMKTVTVSVSWNSGSPLTLKTYIAE